MNMKKAYCTIISSDYLCYALALNSSLLKFDPSVEFNILVADNDVDSLLISRYYDNVKIFNAKQLCSDGSAKRLYDQYAGSSLDCFRWSMKPVYINHLLTQGYEQVFFLDPDLLFFSAFDFLSDDLAGHGVLLTPHWRASNPSIDSDNFLILQTSGLFNAGFIGVSKAGMTAMEWWANACAYRCEKKPDKGFFVDQGYLDLMPVYFNNIKIERHRGCNVANWNQVECKRVAATDGVVRINGVWDIVFIHFTESTIRGIQSGQDALLRPYLKQYLNTLERFRNEVRSWSAKLGSHVVPELTTLESSDRQPVATEGSFPKFSVASLDKFQMRNSILDALRAVKINFEGTLLDVGCGQMPYKSLLTSPPAK